MKENILMISPKFFGYEQDIKDELENQDYNVFYFDDRPSNDFFSKVVIRLNLKKIIQKKINNYYNNIIDRMNNLNIDYLFLVNPETVPLFFINKLKAKNKNIIIYTYFWDSISNRKKALDYLPYSNKFFTFDSDDRNINENIDFLPLFYNKKYYEISIEKNKIEYDLCFIGTIHSNRYEIVKEVEKKLEGKKCFFYFYSPSKILFFFQKILNKEYRNIKYKDVSFISLSNEEVIDVISKSNVILDIEHNKQNGLTMRTIEMLGANKLLLTTNKNIRNYDFYKESNYYQIDRNNIQVDNKFFDNKFECVESKVYNKYSLENWIKEIFKS